jgi:hypothetical protein
MARMSSEACPRALVLYMDAGGGHRAAAHALAAAAQSNGDAGLELRLESLQRILEPLDVTRRVTGRPLEHTYNELVRRGRTGSLVPLLRGLHGLIFLLQRPLARMLARHLEPCRPDLVVSVAPNFNRVIRDAVRQALPAARFLVVLTDYADFPPHFWIEPGLDRVVVGSDHARGQALAMGIPEARVSLTSGMILHPRFYAMGGAEARHRVRNELGFGDQEKVVLLLFGGNGRPEMAPLAKGILEQAKGVRVIAIAGNNPPLLKRLRAVAATASERLHPMGFTDRVVDFMAASDLLVTKPGPGSLAEAFHQGLPVVVTHDRQTIPQERYNTQMIRELELGLVLHRWQEMPAVVAELTGDPDRLRGLTARVAALPRNRAVFEVLEIVRREARAAACRA